MTAFLEAPRFNTGIRYGTVGGPEFNTDVQIVDSGSEKRTANWEDTRGRWSVAEDVFTQTEVAELIAFFRSRRGRAGGFRFKDWADWFCHHTTGRMATVPSNPALLQLVKTYTLNGGASTFRNIRKPVPGAVRIYKDGVLVPNPALDYTTGLLVLPEGSSPFGYQWQGEFDVPARFDVDELDISFDAYREDDGAALYTVRNLTIVELQQEVPNLDGVVITPIPTSITAPPYTPPAYPSGNTFNSHVIYVDGDSGSEPTPPTPPPEVPPGDPPPAYEPPTSVSPGFPDNDLNLSTYGATAGSSAASIIAAFDAAISALKALGGGTLHFDPGVYDLGSYGSGANILNVASAANIQLYTTGATIRINTTVVTTPVIFNITNTENFEADGFHLNDTGAQISENWRGAICFSIQSTSLKKKFRFKNCSTDNVVTFLQMQGTAWMNEEVTVEPTCHIKNAYYGINPNFDGRFSTASYTAENVRRAFISYGGKGWALDITGFNSNTSWPGSNAFVSLVHENTALQDISVVLDYSGPSIHGTLISIQGQADANNAAPYARNIQATANVTNLSSVVGGTNVFRLWHESAGPTFPTTTTREVSGIYLRGSVEGSFSASMVTNSTLSSHASSRVYIGAGIASQVNMASMPSYYALEGASDPIPPPASGIMPYGRPAAQFSSLQWADEFEGSTLSDTWERGSFYTTNGEQYWKVENGAFYMWPVAPFDDQSFTTRGKKTFTPNVYFEIEARLPRGACFPALWLFKDGGTQTELDIMETGFEGWGYFGMDGADPSAPTDYVGTSFSVSGPTVWTVNGSRRMAGGTGSPLPFLDLSAAFHKYGMKWSTAGHEWFFDGVSLGTAPFHPNQSQPMYFWIDLWFNVANRHPGVVVPTISNTPQGESNAFIINYVRQWDLI